MSPTPDIQPLSRRSRTIFFFLIVLIFVLAVPYLIFYAIGYRYQFSGEAEGTITRVGGVFVSSELDEVTMYIDDELVTDMRFFQTAAYIQNLAEGMHKIVVQADGGQTWVKELPVFPHIVTEVESFTMPATSTVRVVPRYLRDNNASVLPATESIFLEKGVLLTNATSSTSSTVANPEWEYLSELFAATSTTPVVESGFTFTTGTTSIATTTANTRLAGDMRLELRDDRIFAKWLGRQDRMPYYFCARNGKSEELEEWYGKHVRDYFYNGGTLDTKYDPASTWWCRDEISIDNLRQEIIDFAFLPDSNDHALLHLSDGLYVVEIDDRAWQNTQQVYAGTDFDMRIDGGRIFVKEDDIIFEVITQIMQ